MFTISTYIIQRLKTLNVDHLFGVPGASCSAFFDEIEKTPGIKSIITTNDLGAGYAADAYARNIGLGAVCVSYGVGTLSIANAIAGALVEKSPVVVINGGPTTIERRREKEMELIFPHSTGRPATDHKVFKLITEDAIIIKNAASAPKQIDQLFQKAITNLAPVYLEVPADLWDAPCHAPKGKITPLKRRCNLKSISNFINIAENRITQAGKPVFIAGVEILRRNLQDEFIQLVEKLNIPFVTTLLAKSGWNENHPLFMGTYDSNFAPDYIRQYVEESGCLISLGCIFSGISHVQLIEKQFAKMIHVGFGKARIGTEHYPLVHLHHVIEKMNSFTVVHMTKMMPRRRINTEKQADYETGNNRHKSIGYADVFDVLEHFTESNCTVFTDTCLASYPGAQFKTENVNGYAANPIWLSIGYTIGAAVGHWFATQKRPIIVVGDGGFQMVAQTISTWIKYKIPGIVLVIDNGTYAIEQFLVDKTFFEDTRIPELPYTKLNKWRYEDISSVFGGKKGIRVQTISQLVLAVAESIQDKRPSIISVEISSRVLPAGNRRALEKQRKAVL